MIHKLICRDVDPGGVDEAIRVVEVHEARIEISACLVDGVVELVAYAADILELDLVTDVLDSVGACFHIVTLRAVDFAAASL